MAPFRITSVARQITEQFAILDRATQPCAATVRLPPVTGSGDSRDVKRYASGRTPLPSMAS